MRLFGAASLRCRKSGKDDVMWELILNSRFWVPCWKWMFGCQRERVHKVIFQDFLPFNTSQHCSFNYTSKPWRLYFSSPDPLVGHSSSCRNLLSSLALLWWSLPEPSTSMEVLMALEGLLSITFAVVSSEGHQDVHTSWFFGKVCSPERFRVVSSRAIKIYGSLDDLLEGISSYLFQYWWP